MVSIHRIFHCYCEEILYLLYARIILRVRKIKILQKSCRTSCPQKILYTYVATSLDLEEILERYFHFSKRGNFASQDFKLVIPCDTRLKKLIIYLGVTYTKKCLCPFPRNIFASSCYKF